MSGLFHGPLCGWLAAIGRYVSSFNQRRLTQRRVRSGRSAWLNYVAQDDPSRPEHAIALAARAEGLQATTKISLIWCRPPSAPREEVRALVQDLQAQIYPHWELILPDTSHDGDRINWEDERIRIVGKGTHSSGPAAFNRLVEEAQGVWVIAWRQAARLPPHALLLMAEAAVSFPDATLVYSDFDHLSGTGQRERPAFLCDRNLELERSGDYLGGLNAYRRLVLVPPSGLAIELGDAAWHDLNLRAFESDARDAVVHVPHVLLHRRDDAPPMAVPACPAELAAVARHILRCGLDAEVLPDCRSGLRVRYRLPKEAPRVTAIIPTRNGLSLLRQCINSLESRTSYPNLDLWIIDNGSDDPDTLGYLREIAGRARVTVRRDDRPFDFAALNNEAVSACGGDVVALLNNDIEAISASWLEEMVGLALQEDVGAVGARLLFPNSTVQHGGVIVGVGGTAGHAHFRIRADDPGYLRRAHQAQDMSAVTAACIVMRKSVYTAVGGMQAGTLAVDLNDVDLCLRIKKAGLRVVWTPHAELIHHESATRGRRKDDSQVRRYRTEAEHFRSTWKGRLEWDPAYNPNLSLRGGPWMFTAAEVPRVTLSRPWMDDMLRLDAVQE